MKKNRLFFVIYIIIIVISIIFIELLFRGLGIGYSTKIFVKQKGLVGGYTDNKDLLLKYYNNEIFFNPPENILSKKKMDNEIRGFVVGGSTADGFPYNSNHSFSKMAEVISNEYSEKDINIFNLGHSAMSSYYVRDISLKLLKYRPDFLVIYSGHNEYYGSVSHITGRSHFSKLVYLYLKEFRLVQVTLNIINNIQNIGKKQTELNLMERQFNNVRIKHDDKLDRKIAERFIKNINSIVIKYAKYNIPVIIIDPISNVANFPPFGGGDTKILLEYYSALLKGDQSECLNFYEKFKYSDKPGLMYLNARVQKEILDKPSYSLFTAAKDFDDIPFRAKSILKQRLADYISTKQNVYSNLYYIPFEDKLSKEYDIEEISKFIFIDHLHFTENGQKLLAYYLLNMLNSVLGLNVKGELKGYFNLNRKNFMEKIYFTDLHEYKIYVEIRNFLNSSLFKSMSVKTNINISLSPDNEIIKDEILLNKLNNTAFNKYEPLVIEYYIEKKEFAKAKKYIESYNWIYPGAAAAKYYYGLLYESIGDIKKADYFYKLSCYLSNNGEYYVIRYNNFLKRKNK